MTYNVFSGTLNPTQSINLAGNDTVPSSVYRGRGVRCAECKSSAVMRSVMIYKWYAGDRRSCVNFDRTNVSMCLGIDETVRCAVRAV